MLLVASVCAALGGVRDARAQEPVRAWEPRGFDFSANGVWRLDARRVARLRAQALARGDFTLLNSAIVAARTAPGRFAFSSAAGAGAAVTGVLKVPALLVRFRNTDTTKLAGKASYDSILFDSVPPRANRPYTVRTFYEEMSHGLMSVQGVVVGWITLDSNELYYAGAGTCDGLCGSAHIAQLIQQAVLHADSTVDFSQFDSHHTGQVDLLWLIKPSIGAECGRDSVIWAHRYYYQAWTGATLATNDGVAINNYTIQSGLGGATACDTTQIMPIGTIAHETGHGLDLPDLYDVGLSSEGIGHWGLMGSGNYARPLSPAHMEAFSLSQLGWVALQGVSAEGAYTLNPVETSDTVMVIKPDTAIVNSHHEYFLLENRRGIKSDTGLITRDGGGVGGLLVWHVDSLKFSSCTLPANNCVNVGLPHGVELMQADGLGQLDGGLGNRGDAGDPFPGSSGNTSFASGTTPSTVLNTVGSPIAGFALDSIRSASSTGPITFRLRRELLRAAVMGAPYTDTLPPVAAGYTFALATGTLPPGLTLSSAGVVSGIPTKDSSYTATAQAVSGSTTLTVPVHMTVTAPALAVDSVVKQFLLGGNHLTADQLRFLDLNGNTNASYDIGDVVAWLDKYAPALSTRVLSRLLRRQW